MIDQEPTAAQRLVIWLTAAVAWLSGEVGRATIAGSAGGLFRWLVQSQRRIRDGVISVGAGAIAAAFLSEFTKALMIKYMEIEVGAYPVGFITGLLGMSAAKIAILFVENRGEKAAQAKGDE